MKRNTTITSEETQNDTEVVKVAVLNNDMKHLGESMNRLEAKFDAAILGFVTHDKLMDMQKSADAKHSEQDKAINSLEEWNKWAIRIILGAFLSGLAGAFFIFKP